MHQRTALMVAATVTAFSLTATIIAPSACQAEVAAKTVLILGLRDGLDWLEARPALAGLVVLDDGQVINSRRLLAYLWS